MKNLHLKIRKDKYDVSPSKARHHNKIEEDYARLQKDIEIANKKTGKAKIEHHKKLHKKAINLHHRAIKHDHPTLKDKINNVVNTLASAVQSGERKIAKEYNKDRALVQKLKKEQKEKRILRKEQESKIEEQQKSSQESQPKKESWLDSTNKDDWWV